MSDICPLCGKQGRVEKLRTPVRTGWRCCGACGQIWVTAPELDPFSAIVASPAVFARAQPGERPPNGRLRALRFAVRLPVRYRAAGSLEWSEGLTENISRSGVFFRVEGADERDPTPWLSQSTPMEMVLEVSGRTKDEGDLEIRCEGRVVRTMSPEMPGLLPGVGVAVRSYRLHTAAAA